MNIRKVFGPLAQLVEQFPFKEWVVGSSPTGLTNKFKLLADSLLLFHLTTLEYLLFYLLKMDVCS